MVTISLADKNLDRDALHDLVTAFYTYQIKLLPEEVAAQVSVEGATQDFWEEIDTYFAPNGALALAHDDKGALLGCGMMRKIRPDAAEFKRMFVRPAGRGQGIGRLLIEKRMEAARNLGIRSIFADTLVASKTMHGIYRDLGFRQIPRYPESHTVLHYPAVASELIYFQLDL